MKPAILLLVIMATRILAAGMPAMWLTSTDRELPTKSPSGQKCLSLPILLNIAAQEASPNYVFLWGTLHFELVTHNGKVIRGDYSRGVTFDPVPKDLITLRPGRAFYRAYALVYENGVLAIGDETGGAVVWRDIKPGRYRVRATYQVTLKRGTPPYDFLAQWLEPESKLLFYGPVSCGEVSFVFRGTD